ncbi:hypothetical protein EYF80_065221 [Liparis tanakae]|uniref:Uncharacterized protein n=1 Tax=Liparis tanakae TaxID=230148 RepID=A0A4Z2E7M0_9TELE|nr:hypothetical protein EYF80_065221 [Liparis tanakae]
MSNTTHEEVRGVTPECCCKRRSGSNAQVQKKKENLDPASTASPCRLQVEISRGSEKLKSP